VFGKARADTGAFAIGGQLESWSGGHCVWLFDGRRARAMAADRCASSPFLPHGIQRVEANARTDSLPTGHFHAVPEHSHGWSSWDRWREPWRKKRARYFDVMKGPDTGRALSSSGQAKSLANVDAKCAWECGVNALGKYYVRNSQAIQEKPANLRFEQFKGRARFEAPRRAGLKRLSCGGFLTG